MARLSKYKCHGCEEKEKEKGDDMGEDKDKRKDIELELEKEERSLFSAGNSWVGRVHDG